jgi:hypothetical protein
MNMGREGLEEVFGERRLPVAAQEPGRLAARRKGG